MKTWINIEDLGKLKEGLSSLAIAVGKKPGVRFCDIRLGVDEGFSISAEDVTLKSFQKDFSLSYGVRVIAGPSKASANGFFNGRISANDFSKTVKILSQAVEIARSRAVENAKRKILFKARFPELAKSLLAEAVLARIPAIHDTVKGDYQIDPRKVSKKEAEKAVLHAQSLAKRRFKEIKNSLIAVFSYLERQIFASCEGSLIDQTFAFTGATVFFTVVSGNLEPIDLSHHIGNQCGWEALAEKENVYQKNLDEFSLMIANEAITLAKAKSCPTSKKPVVVVTDPDFNSLLIHEIIGHPAELDRALKWETGYAGRSRFFKNFQENHFGKQVASPLVSAFSDPTLKGAYGHYFYDDEGTKAQRVYHIKQGVFCDFMNSRETAAILGARPNGHYKANSPSAVPLIRMSVSVFEEGEQDPGKIIREVDKGFYIVGHRTPSISESREHFRISPRLVYEIKKGKLGQIFRDGSIQAYSEEYLKSVNAVGSDFKIFPIPNCGKGQPMQTKMLGNGGPTMRGLAYLVGKK